MTNLHAGQTGRKNQVSSDSLTPIFVSIKQAAELTAESEWRVKELLAAGIYEAVKSGLRTLIKYRSVEARAAALPDAKFAPPRRKVVAG